MVALRGSYLCVGCGSSGAVFVVLFGKVMFRFSIGEFCLEFFRDCGSSGAVLVSLVSVYEGNVGIQSFGFSAICNSFAVWPCPLFST